jgi:hypothetical protein
VPRTIAASRTANMLPVTYLLSIGT